MGKTDLRIIAAFLLSLFTDAGTYLPRHIKRKVIDLLATFFVGIESQVHTLIPFQTPGDASLYSHACKAIIGMMRFTKTFMLKTTGVGVYSQTIAETEVRELSSVEV
jgi:hypothetical protein